MVRAAALARQCLLVAYVAIHVAGAADGDAGAEAMKVAMDDPLMLLS